MDLKQELKTKLGVPENWDKHDYESLRFSFDDIYEVLTQINQQRNQPPKSINKQILRNGK